MSLIDPRDAILLKLKVALDELGIVSLDFFSDRTMFEHLVDLDNHEPLDVPLNTSLAGRSLLAAYRAVKVSMVACLVLKDNLRGE